MSLLVSRLEMSRHLRQAAVTLILTDLSTLPSVSNTSFTISILSPFMWIMSSLFSCWEAFYFEQLGQMKFGSSLKTRSPNHLIWHQHWQGVQKMEFDQVPPPHTPQGYLPDLITSLFFPVIINFVFPGFTFMPLLSWGLFHSMNFCSTASLD